MNNDIKQILAVLDRLVAVHQRGFWDYVTIVAVVLTFFVLIWYTRETYKLRVAADKQYDVAITPILTIVPVPRNIAVIPAIRNVGNGPAFNISIEAANIEQQAKLDFSFPDILVQNECVELTLFLRKSNGARQIYTQDDITTNIVQGHLPETIPLTITYDGVNRQKYCTSMVLEHKSELLFYRFVQHSKG